MTTQTRAKSRGLASWLASGICVSVAVLTWFGYRGIREWQRSSTLLVERRANEAADLLVTALTRDMHAVQKLVLSSVDLDAFLLDSPYDVSHMVASAFARYPYPEAFFAGRGALTAERLMFFTRSDRPPPWVRPGGRANRFPVSVENEPALADAIVARIRRDVASGRRFSIFEVRAAGLVYQVITRLLYRDQLHERLDGVFGFMVNMPWARRYYFPELTRQIARMGRTASGLALAVVDDRGARVTSTSATTQGTPTSRRSFPIMFFDPLLVAVDQPADLPRQEWAVQVSGAADPTLLAAIHGANRTLIIAALAAASLAIGLVMTARAVRASANLAELRSEFVSTVTHELKAPIATIRAVGDTLVSGRIATSAGQREYAELVVQEAKRLTRLVDNLLALSRITDVTEVYSFESLALDALVDKTLKDFNQPLSAGAFATDVEIPADLPLVRADRTAMGLMLDNLVDNAIRYSPTLRWLRIAARRGGDGLITLDVSDKGRGIPKDELDQVTRRFFRGRGAVSNGSGLGLAIVKRIVTDHGGRLEIRSVVDTGTTVSVTIPSWKEDEETDSRR